MTVFLAASTVIAALSLLSMKMAHRIILNSRGVRTAHYVAAVAEMIGRRYIPTEIPKRWRTDPAFHDVVIDYRRLVEGEDGRFIDRMVEEIGIVDALIPRIRWIFPQTSRLQAVSTFVELADRSAAPFLRSLLDDRNAYVQTHAAHGLARIHDLTAVPMILDLSTRVRPWEAARLTDSLVAFGVDAVPLITEWASDEMDSPRPSLEAVTQAARVLGFIGDSAAEPLLLRLLSSPILEWRVAAASALGRVGTDEARDALLFALADNAWEVRARAVRALTALADETVGPAVASLLSDTEWWVRQNAAETLGEIPGGMTHLLEALDSPDRFAADSALNQLAEMRKLPPGRLPLLVREPAHDAATTSELVETRLSS
ncbi:MAG TPA: HEAT repeat domain-containing protein [Acidimicrobiia bacterium]|nr:HEAT repeat domain-containing protein [Acidimicrobiia bacterium]